MTAEMRTAVDKTASNSASVPDAVRSSDLAFFPFERKQRPRPIFAKIATEITISEIITTVEGPIAVVDCLLAEAEAEDQPCKRACACVTRGIWEKVCDSISGVLDSITLQTLMDNDGSRKHVGCGR